MKKNCIWGFSYGPPYDEAGKNRVNELSNYFGIYLTSTGRINKLISKSDNSIIFKRSVPGLFLFMLYSLWYLVLKCGNVIIVKNPDCFALLFWSILLKNKVIHISNEFLHEKNISNYHFYFKYVFPRLKAMGVTNKKEKDVIERYTNSKFKTFLFLPEVNLKKFSCTPPPKISPFTILFASAPMTKEAFENKGIEVMLNGFKKFSKEVNSKLIIVWRRNRYTNLLSSMESLINSINLNNNVVIINDEIKSMQALYSNSHITMLINKNHLDTPNYPRSLIESLSVGRPVITSSINEISEIILKENAGSVCNLSEDSVYSALVDCYNNYYERQLKSRSTAEMYFDISNKAELFEKLLQGR